VVLFCKHFEEFIYFEKGIFYNVRFCEELSSFTNDSFVAVFLISDGQIINATGSGVMFDESNSGDFFAELFENDDAFQKRPMFRVIEILEIFYAKFVVYSNLFHADKPLARRNQFVSEVWYSSGARF